MIKNKKILITGGAGFLGSHLCYRLFEHNYVIALDNLSTGRLENIKNLVDNNKIKFIKHDIVNPININDIYIDDIDNLDLIFNFACPASPPHYQADPIQTTKTCVYGAINVLELAKKTGAKILQASTSEIYGDPQVHPQVESYRGSVNTIGIRSCYDEGKRCAESLFFDYKRMHDVDIRVVRIFNTYGPNMDPKDGRVVSNFIMQAIQNKPLTIYGDGKQTRSFCYVDDLIDVILLMMESDFVGPVNIGNPVEFNLLELSDLILELTGSKSEIVFDREMPLDDPTRRRPDITLAKDKLGWEPKVSLSDGLEKTIKYFKKVV